MPTDPQVLLVVFDGLRRDLIDAALMPTLHAFLRDGADFPGARSVFPSATRVNAAAIGSGCVPGVSGVVANQFFDPRVFPDRILHTGRVADVDTAMRAYDGRFVAVDGLADLLVAHGRRIAVVTSASGGTTRMLNPRVQANGQVSLCLRDWPSSRPARLAAQIAATFGPPPKPDMPALALTRRVTDIFLDWIAPEMRPDLAVLWYGDPDYTFHYRGLGSPAARDALREADRQLARLLDWARAPTRGRPVQIIVASDHGHLNAVGRVPAGEALRGAGFDLDPTRGDGPLAGAALQVGAVQSRGRDGSARLRDLAAWLLEQPWCGPVFTANGEGPFGTVPGTFNRSLVLNDHARSADLFYVLRASDAPGPFGIPGTTPFVGSALKDGGSTHGGLHHYEMQTVLAASGRAFRPRFRSDLPCGVIDIAPTVLTLFGIGPPAHMSGRPLAEALAAAAAGTIAEEPEEETWQVAHAGGADTLRRRRLGRHVYLQDCTRTAAGEGD